MFDAGRIGFIIRGNYNVNETYNFLDVVFNPNTGKSYVAKRTIKGIEPINNTDDWQIFVEGVVKIDSELDNNSENPVQNKAIFEGLEGVAHDVQDTINALEERTLDSIGDLNTKINTLSDEIAQPFSPEEPYTAGTYVMYNGNIYEFKNTHLGAWSESDVEPVPDVMGEVSEVKEDLSWLDKPFTLMKVLQGYNYAPTETISSNFEQDNLHELFIYVGGIAGAGDSKIVNLKSCMGTSMGFISSFHIGGNSARQYNLDLNYSVVVNKDSKLVTFRFFEFYYQANGITKANSIPISIYVR